MINVGSYIVGSVKGNSQTKSGTNNIIYNTPFYVEFLNREGAFKRGFYLNSNDNPILEIKFKLNKQGPSDGSVEFAYIDWTIDRFDIVNIYYNGTKIYSGLVDSKPDLDGGEIALIPKRSRLKDLIFERKTYFQGLIHAKTILINFVFTSTKAKNSRMFYSPTKIESAFLNKDTTALVSPRFEDTDYESIIKQLIDQIDSDANWGIDENDMFFINYPETQVSARLEQGDTPDFDGVDISTNYDNIKLTRAIVYRAGDTDNGEADDVYCGKVCFEDSAEEFQPIASLENETGAIECVVSIDTVLVSINGTTDSQRKQQKEQAKKLALTYAYNKIKAQQVEKSIELKKINLGKFIPKCNKRIQIVKTYTKPVMWTLVDCETAEGWDVGEDHFLPDRKLHGTRSLYVGGNFPATYSFGRNISGINALECYVYGVIQNTILRIKISDNEFEFCLNSGWNRIEIDISKTTFSSISFKSDSYFCLLNEINAYSPNKQVYEGNITEIQYTIKEGDVTCNATLGNYDVAVNDVLQELDWKIKTLEKIKKIDTTSED